MSLTDRKNLAHVMLSVDEMKLAPLRNTEGTKNMVACALHRAKKLFSLVADGVKAEEMLTG